MVVGCGTIETAGYIDLCRRKRCSRVSAEKASAYQLEGSKETARCVKVIEEDWIDHIANKARYVLLLITQYLLELIQGYKRDHVCFRIQYAMQAQPKILHKRNQYRNPKR